MGNNDIKVKDLADTSSITTSNKLMVLTDEANNTVQNITVENALANIISSNANNNLSIGTDKKLYSADISSEVGDLDNLITITKTDIVRAINEVKGDTNAITGEVVSASKGWLEEGKIYQKAYWYGEKLYNDVYGYNHSTFDKSKFNVEGTPTITDDGIASGFVNSTNYIQAYSLNAMPSMLVIKAKVRTENTLTAAIRTAVCGKNSEDSNVRFYVRGDGSNASRLVIGYKKSDATYFNTFINISANTEYDINITINSSNITVSINDTEIVNGNNLYTANNIESIGVGSMNGNNCWLGSIDLKAFSITVDGIPVFSGNKTGIDTIKPADFTAIVNGVSTVNPTLPITGSYLNITADGIASGFSSSDYIKTSTISYLNNFTQILKIRTPNTTPTATEGLWVEDTSTTYRSRMGLTTAMKLNMFLTSNGSNWDIGEKTENSKILALNTEYIIKLEFNGSTYKVYLSEDNGNTYVELTGLSMTSTAKLRDLPIRLGQHLDTSPFSGSIDLNAFKVYVDGNLIYQPCLLIPYNESSTGSKIVDVAYRDRVIDVYNQYGSANYYTIDETNKNATLPMGEIYGFIRQADSDKIYKDLVPCYDSTKAISVPLFGNYTAPADGYVCSPNMVLVLDPDNGYENFSLSIMRNTQSMTMISCTGPTAFPFCLPVLKDDVLTVAADATVTSNVYFIPREGV